jgi:hypothetical protein
MITKPERKRLPDPTPCIHTQTEVCLQRLSIPPKGVFAERTTALTVSEPPWLLPRLAVETLRRTIPPLFPPLAHDSIPIAEPYAKRFSPTDF